MNYIYREKYIAWIMIMSNKKKKQMIKRCECANEKLEDRRLLSRFEFIRFVLRHQLVFQQIWLDHRLIFYRIQGHRKKKMKFHNRLDWKHFLQSAPNENVSHFFLFLLSLLLLSDIAKDHLLKTKKKRGKNQHNNLIKCDPMR